MSTVAHSFMNSLHPKNNDCVSIICRHSLYWVLDKQRWIQWTRSLYQQTQIPRMNMARESPKGVFASLPGINLVYNLSFNSVYPNSFKREEGTWEKSSPGRWDTRCGINLTTLLLLPHQASSMQESFPERLLHYFYLEPIIRLELEVSRLFETTV